MTKSRKRKETQKEQSRRFIEAAGEAEASEHEAVFDEALKRITRKTARPKPPKEEDGGK